MLIQLYLYSILISVIYSRLIALEAGHSRVFPHSTTLTLYIHITYTGNTEVTLKIINDECCLEVERDDLNCRVFKLEQVKFATLSSGGQAGSSKRVEYLLHNMYLSDRLGYCTFNIISSDHTYKEQITMRINTTISDGTNNDGKKCISVDLDRELSCNPANCVLKYEGSRNYFNPATLKCEPVPDCNTLSEDQLDAVAYYDSGTNTCIKLRGGLVEDTTVDTDESFDEEILNYYA